MFPISKKWHQIKQQTHDDRQSAGEQVFIDGKQHKPAARVGPLVFVSFPLLNPLVLGGCRAEGPTVSPSKLPLVLVASLRPRSDRSACFETAGPGNSSGTFIITPFLQRRRRRR